MMRIRRFIPALACCFAGILTAAEPLATALSRMDANALKFTAMSATILRTVHNEAVGVDSKETGSMLLKRPAPRDMRMLIDFAPPEQKTVSLQGEIFDIFYPKINTVQEYPLGKYRGLLDQFFLLGFGSSGKDLSASYTISSLGPETVAGQKTVHLQLIPKTKTVLEQLRKVELWLSDESGYPVQQKLFLPSGDSQTMAYSSVKINPRISDSALKLKLPKGVLKVYPAK